MHWLTLHCSLTPFIQENLIQYTHCFWHSQTSNCPFLCPSSKIISFPVFLIAIFSRQIKSMLIISDLPICLDQIYFPMILAIFSLQMKPMLMASDLPIYLDHLLARNTIKTQGPIVWNSIDFNICSSTSVKSFKEKYKHALYLNLIWFNIWGGQRGGQTLYEICPCLINPPLFIYFSHTLFL